MLGPDVPTTPGAIDYVAYVSDQDAYACSGQKCSAQSIVFAHRNWVKAGEWVAAVTEWVSWLWAGCRMGL